MTLFSRASALLFFGAWVLASPTAGAQSGKPGSLLFFPEYDNDCQTLITVTNSNNSLFTGDISTRWIYVHSPGCTVIEHTELLPAADTISVVTSAHCPGAGRGYLYVYAIDPDTDEAVSFNHLIGASMRFDCMGGSEYAIDPVAFQSPIAEHAPTDVDLDGARDLDAVEYGRCPDRILLPRFLGQSASISSELILINLTGQLDSVAVAELSIFNDNEVPFSLQRTFQCWEKVALGTIGGTFENAFLQGTANDALEINGEPAQEAGWFAVNGISATDAAGTYADPATLAFLIERRNGRRAGSTPFGSGLQSNGDLPPAVQPPVCPDGAMLRLWPADHRYVAIDLASSAGVTDPQSLPLTFVVTSITQDEPVNGTADGNTSCDAYGLETSVANVRAERSMRGNGRVYRIHYTATNSAGLSCSSSMSVAVPRDLAHAAVGDPDIFESTQGCP